MRVGEPGYLTNGRLTLQQFFPRRVALVCAIVLVAQVIAMALLIHDLRAPTPHDAPVSVVAPAIVAYELADEVNGLDEHPLDVTPGEDEGAAIQDVRRGVSVGALIVDLTGTRDRLVLSGAVDRQLLDAVQQQVSAIAGARGRTFEVEYVAVGTVGDDVVRGLSAGFGALGFLLALVLSLRLGPVARTIRLGSRRIMVVAVTSLVAGYAAAALLPGVNSLDQLTQLQIAAVVGLIALVAATITLSLEGLVGFGGLGLTSTFYLVIGTPQLLGIDPRLLHEPWPLIAAWSPAGAGVDALAAVALFGGAGLRMPVLVLVVWLLAAVLLLLVARHHRQRSNVRADAGLDDLLLPGETFSQATQHGLLMRWRWRVLAVVVPSMIAAFAVVSLIPRDVVVAVAPVPTRASEALCVASGQVRGVADLNRIARTVRGGPEFQGGDVGADTELQDGRRLMVFGDTLRNPSFGGQRFVRNSMLVIGGECIQTIVPEDHGALIPDRPSPQSTGQVGYWPMSVVTVTKPGYDLVVVTCQRVRGTGDGAFDFESLGPAIAVFVVAPGDTPQLISVRDVGPDSPSVDRPEWGAATAIDDGWLYLYGTANPDELFVFGFSLRVARVRPEDVLQPKAWRYWDGSDWVTDPTDAQELIPAEGGTSQTLSVFTQDGAWYALSKRNEFLGSDVVVWSAPAPWGPFDGGSTVATLPSAAVEGRLHYTPLAHPGLLPVDGTVVVSYSQNRTDVDQVISDPTRYRPRFIRVELP